MSFALFFGAVWLSVVGLVLAFRFQKKKARTAEMEHASKSLGLRFAAKDAFGLIPQLQNMPLFRREKRRWFRNGKIVNLMSGTVGDTQVYLFDYCYTVSTGKSSKEVRQTVFFADDKNLDLPDFSIKPETWWHKVKSALGVAKDLNFEEHGEFSEKFWLTGNYEEAVRARFTPEIRRFLMENPPVHVEGENYYLIAYKPGMEMEGDGIPAFFKACCAMVELFKGEQREDLLDLAEMNRTEMKREKVKRK